MKLTDTQAAVLAAAAAHNDGAILPLPLAPARRRHRQGHRCPEGERLAVAAGEGGEERLLISDAGRQALKQPIAPMPAAVPDPTAKTIGERTPRTGTKQAQLIAMLKAPEGASVEEIVAIFGWQPHTVRGAIAGALKKLGL